MSIENTKAGLSFSRNKVVGVEAIDDNTFAAHGVLEDCIYAMELDVKVRVPDFEIAHIEGKMNRFTTPVCEQAIPKLQNAVGMRVPEEEFARKIHRVVGREGCTHFANLLIECCDAIVQAAVYSEWQELKRKGEAPEKEEYLKGKLRGLPGLQHNCTVYSRLAGVM